MVLSMQPISMRSSTGEVIVHPGDDIQKIVAAHAAGASFVISPGIYRLQSIQPKNGDTFTGERGTILNGAQLLNAFQREGPCWVTQVAVKSLRSYRGQCDATHAACMYPEDLFYDSKPLRRVASLSLVAPGAWYLDYSTNKVYAGSDPGGHTVEMSVARAAFWGSASNVTIMGLTIEKYASIAGKGAINAIASLDGYGPVGTGWVVESNDLYLNHGLGIRVSDGMTVRSRS
ncbi:MAG TPA: hypothetical protein VNM47_14985 [Terriglobia bacterium]|nr:hypothetical protein [Terriglobia bacterium]